MVTPLLFSLFIATIQMGHMYGVMANLRTASAVAARVAILGTAQSTSEVCDAARASLLTSLNSSQLSCQTSPAILPLNGTAPITVTLTYPVSILAPGNGAFQGPTLNLTAQTTMQ
jgi:Flp pilus assembly protein TadG